MIKTVGKISDFFIRAVIIVIISLVLLFFSEVYNNSIFKYLFVLYLVAIFLKGISDIINAKKN